MSEAKAAAAKTPEKMFLISIGLGNDQEPVKQFVGANGRDYLIQRGKDVVVPQAVLNVLDDAVMGVAEVDPDDNTKTIVVERKRFPYTIKGVVS
jgi:hypothetical protein